MRRGTDTVQLLRKEGNVNEAPTQAVVGCESSALKYGLERGQRFAQRRDPYHLIKDYGRPHFTLYI